MRFRSAKGRMFGPKSAIEILNFYMDIWLWNPCANWQPKLAGNLLAKVHWSCDWNVLRQVQRTEFPVVDFPPGNSGAPDQMAPYPTRQLGRGRNGLAVN